MSVRLPALVTLLALLLAGCGQAATAPQSATPAAPTSGAFPLTVVDSLGREVRVPRSPRRIVSLSPKNTELLFALGAGEQVVGVTKFCNYPPEAQSRPQVGGFVGQTLNVEAILALEPDLICAAGDLHQGVIATLDRLEIPVLALAADTFDGLYTEIDLLSRLLGAQARGEELAEGIRERLAAVETIAGAIPPDKRSSVLYLVWDQPLMAAGDKSFIGQLLEAAGARNVFADIERNYPQVSEEAILARDPEVLLLPDDYQDPEHRQRLERRPLWDELGAVRTGKVRYIDTDLVSRCGPRLPEALEEVAAAVHPEHFSRVGKQEAAP